MERHLHCTEIFCGHATSRKVSGSRLDEVNFSNVLIFPALGFTQSLTEMSTRSRKVVFLGSREWPVRRADNLIAIYEPRHCVGAV
jgi:hypothetical protein